MNEQAVSLRELAFVRDVLIPRAWVQGPEVDELVRLRERIEAIFSDYRAVSPCEREAEDDRETSR